MLSAAGRPWHGGCWLAFHALHRSRGVEWHFALENWYAGASPHPYDVPMTLHLGLAPIISLLAGILILVFPRLLSTIVALYLIVIGILGLLGIHQLRL